MSTNNTARNVCRTTALVIFIGVQAASICVVNAADHIVDAPSTTTNGGTTVNDGDSLTVTIDGSIATTGTNVSAVSASDNNTVTNNGSLSTTGLAADGISAHDGNRINNNGSIVTKNTAAMGIFIYNNNEVNNFGSIVTENLGAIGISVQNGNTIINSGTISSLADDADGIQAVDNNTISNNGLISTQGDGAEGIRAQNDNNITNSQSISTQGFNSDGIEGLNNNIINNDGAISTNGLGADGILVDENNTVTNSGSITTNGINAYGIEIGASNTVTNSGSISTNGISANGIVAQGIDNTIINSGSISTNGLGADGIISVDDGNVISNSGTITTTEADANGIEARTDNNTITNSGSIISAKADAFLFWGSNNTLNMNGPSFIGGEFNLGTNTSLNINTNQNHSVLWTIDPAQLAGGAPTVTGSAGAFYNPATMQFATIDTTAFAASTDSLAGMTGLISDVTRGRMSSAKNEQSSEVGNKGWADIAGGFARYDGGGSVLDSKQTQVALMVGYDWSLSPNMLFGVMAGYSQGELRADSRFARSADNDTKGLFAGIYGHANYDNSFFSFGLTGGASRHEDDRFVNDNLQVGGVAHAQSEYDSAWINPRLSYGLIYDLGGGWVTSPTVHLSYAGQWIDGYTETGSNANAIVGKRQIGVGELALEWSATMQTGASTLTGRVGYAYRAAFGDSSTDVTMIGISQSVANNSKDRHIGYFGGDALFALSETVDLKFGAQVEFGKEQFGTTASVKLISKF